MRYSMNRWQAVAIALTLGAIPSDALFAAQPKTANGNRVTRTAHQQPAESAPSVMAPSSRTPARPAPAERIERPRATAPIQGEIIDEGTIIEGAVHRHRSGHPGHDFADMSFNEDCLGPSCRPCSSGPLWVKADFILWWRSGQELPPLVTTAPDATPLSLAGEIGPPTTSILFGGEREDYPVRPGGRIEAGTWFDACQCFGIGGRFYWAGDAELSYANSSTGSPILAIPFTEGANGTADARVIAYPGTFRGEIDFRGTSEVFGGDAYGRMLWCRTDWGRLDLVAGYQFARINEGLTLDSTVTNNSGATNQLIDTFRTTNEFHGGMIGVAAHIDRCWYHVDLMAKVGLGNMHETVDIRGQSISTVGGTTSVLNGGLFAQGTNIGEHSRSEFVAIPEFNANVGWCITDCIDFNIGYTLIVFTGVARPGDAIDTTVNTTQIGSALTGPARPAFTFTDSDMVLHGLNMGVTFKW